MKIAVIVAAYNAELYIADALASLLRQRQDALLDIIVTNDGSTDGTGEIVRGIVAQAPEVRLIETPNGGIAAARNSGLRHIASDTDLVTFLDSDDLSPPGRFARDLKHFADDPALGFHYGRMRMFRGTGEDRLAPEPGGRFIDVRGIQLGASLMRRDLAEAIGLFDEQYVQGEDTDYFFRMFQQQPKMLVVEDICVYYRRHDTNITRQKELSNRYYARAILEHIRRVKAGGVQVPDGFFDGRAFIEGINWW